MLYFWKRQINGFPRKSKRAVEKRGIKWGNKVKNPKLKIPMSKSKCQIPSTGSGQASPNDKCQKNTFLQFGF